MKLRATCALTLFSLSLPAAAQESQRPVIVTPPVGDFDLQPSRPTPTPAPTPAVQPAPTVVQPVPIPTPSVSPRPAAARPAARPTPPVASPSVAASVPTPAATVAPAIPGPTVEPPPPVESDAASNAALPAEVGAEAGEATPIWIWAVLGGLLLLGAGGLIGWLMGRGRRNRYDDEPEAVEPQVAPVPAPPPAPGPPARVRQPAATPAVPAMPPPEGSLVTELRPLRAGIRDGLVTLDFELFVQNRGTESADNVRAVLALLGANAQQDEHLARFYGSARMATGSEPFSIAPGGVFMLNGQVSLPDGQMPAVTVQGKPMFVPIVPVTLRWYAGLSIKTLRDAFMVGTVPAQGGDRLGPLWVERAASGFGPLAAKRYAPAN